MNKAEIKAKARQALAMAQDAIEELDSLGVFQRSERDDPDVAEDVDTDEAEEWVVALETALDVAADHITRLVVPTARDALTINELLAHFVRQGRVERAMVTSSAELLECLKSDYESRDRELGQKFTATTLREVIIALGGLVA